MTTQILITDKTGVPKDWVDTQDAACYFARDKVVWGTGQIVETFRGGMNKDGVQSMIEIPAIIGVTGPILGDQFYSRQTVYADRFTLYARDRHICGYCGQQFKNHDLTIDHVHPKSRGGKNTWVNCVAACKPCNHRKGDRTPEEAKMPLLFVPYSPTVAERMLLKGRNVLSDQMDFLMASIPKTSRLWLN